MSRWKKKKTDKKNCHRALLQLLMFWEFFGLNPFFFFFLNYPTPPLSFLLTVPTSLVQITFSSQPSSAAKIKDGGYNFHHENTEHSRAKIKPALKA